MSDAIVPRRSENASKVYTTDVITRMFAEEGGSLFDSRSASLGHIMQGGIPSPMDRARAVRLSLKCMAFIERYHDEIQSQPRKSKHAPPESAAVITIQGSQVKWVPVQEVLQHTNMEKRTGKSLWWADTKELVEALVGRPQFTQL
jgi:6-phosphofructokinase 1